MSEVAGPPGAVDLSRVVVRLESDVSMFECMLLIGSPPLNVSIVHRVMGCEAALAPQVTLCIGV